MKPPRTIQTKRTLPKSGLRVLHATTRPTRKKKHRASTAAAPEDLGEVPGVGVARALVVILLLHVAAIAGIWIHNKWSEGADLKANQPALKAHSPPAPIAGLQRYTVNSGDSLDKIADKTGVERDALMRVNDGMETFEAGWVINLPLPLEDPDRPNAATEPRPARTYGPDSRPMIQTSDNDLIEGSEPGEMVEANTSEPILIRPRNNAEDSPQPARERVQTERPASPASSARRHTVRKNETLWRIAHDNGVSVDALKRANPSVRDQALQIGAVLIIPPK